MEKLMKGCKMSKLSVDQQTIKGLFEDKKTDFLIPDYQRPYAWEEKECRTLWDDIFSFAFPDRDCNKFNAESDEYFLGPIVTFQNNGKKEVIDGQQRLTTLMLLLRAFYDRFSNMEDENSKETRKNIERCIWKTDEFGHPLKEALKIDSQVATDNDKDEFLNILKTGEIHKENKSQYAQNYRFFQEMIDEFLKKYPSYFPHLPTRILNNCILLPIEADTQDTALRIFSTLNDRGKPLADADIFKAELYKYYSAKNKKDDFIKDWKELEEKTDLIFASSGYSMDELFTQYMYYERAKKGTTSSTTEALRKFYEQDKYNLLKNDLIFPNLKLLAQFWEDISRQESNKFTPDVLKNLYILNYAPNGMWTYFVSVYYMQHKDNLDNEAFARFLKKITAFIFAYALTNPGVNALRTPVYTEMTKIVNNQDVDFKDFRFDENQVRNVFDNYIFSNNRAITRSILTWWMFQEKDQTLPLLDTKFEIEHIFAKNRQDKENSLSDKKYLELLGNKALLEKRINIRASDYRFSDKKKYYLGEIKQKEKTCVQELIKLAQHEDFKEEDIISRNKQIIDSFIDYLRKEDLIKE